MQSEKFDFDSFKEELRVLINRHGVDNYCNMHDFVLADLLFNTIMQTAHAFEREGKLKTCDTDVWGNVAEVLGRVQDEIAKITNTVCQGNLEDLKSKGNTFKK